MGDSTAVALMANAAPLRSAPAPGGKRVAEIKPPGVAGVVATVAPLARAEGTALAPHAASVTARADRATASPARVPASPGRIR